MMFKKNMLVVLVIILCLFFCESANCSLYEKEIIFSVDDTVLISETTGLIVSGNSELIVSSGINLQCGQDTKIIVNSNGIFRVYGSLELKDGSELVVEAGGSLIIESGAKIVIEGNAKITGDFGQSLASIVITDDSKLTFGAGSYINLIHIPIPSLQLGVNSELVLELNSIFRFGSSALTECNTESKITVQDGGALVAGEYSSFIGIDTWEGIIAEIGSSVTFNTTSIRNAVVGISALSADINIQHSSFTNCDNGITLVSCNDYILDDNYFYGKDTGTGIALTQCHEKISNNTIDNFNRGVRIVSCSPILLGNTITNNRYNGVYVTGLNSIPGLIDYENTNSTLNNTIVDNGKILFDGGILPISISPSQICVVSWSNIYMVNGKNNIYLNSINPVPAIPCISTISLILDDERPIIQTIDARNNYWGWGNVNNDFFAVGGGYRIVYDPYALTAYELGFSPPPVYSSHEPPTKESILLKNAIKLEYSGNFNPSIKMYEMIIDKYENSAEYYVAMARLPHIYTKAEIILDPLVRSYDEQLVLDDESVNKKFFKEMKVATHLKGKKYDDAIAVSEEMLVESETEEEEILCQIDITIANMLKNANNKGKSTTDHAKTLNDLLTKLNGDEGKGEVKDTIDNGEFIIVNYELYQNYPNPFNPTTEIKFALPTASDVKLNVYNINGQLISELVNGNKVAGIHTVNFDASNFNSGMYFYTLEANGMSITKKMILTK